MSRSARGVPIALLTAALLLAACGQKPGVFVESDVALAPPTSGVGDTSADGPATGAATAAVGSDGSDGSHGAVAPPSPPDDGDAPASGATAEGGTPAGSSRDTRRGDEPTPGRSSPRSGDSGQQPASRSTPQGTDRTGVTGDRITLGIHAPVTGAAPVPVSVFAEAGDLYWRWILGVQEQKVLGRSEVDLRFADDRFEPSTARQVCRELAADNFLLIGGAGADGISACGQLAAQIRVPYLSAGVTEAGLRDNPWYFAMSMSYVQQGDLLAQMVQRRFPGRKVAAVAFNSRSADDGLAAWEAAVDRHGIDYHRSLRTPPGQSNWYGSFAQELGDAGVEVINIGVTPLDYIRFAQVAREQGHDFHYVGVGPTMGVNGVLGSGCPAVGNGTFLSPIPSVDLIDDLAPDFRRAARHFGVEPQDTALALWAINKSIHQLLEQYGDRFGDDLTREDFRALVSHEGQVETGIFPPVRIRPEDHFGGRSMHVLEADCDRQVYADGGTFVSEF